MPLPWLIGGAAVALGGSIIAALSDDDATIFPKIKSNNQIGKTSLNEVIGVIVSAKRKSLGLKQKDFSDLIGLTDSSVSKIEKGSTSLNIESLFIILSVLNITLDEFRDLLQLSLYILMYKEKIYVYLPNDLKPKKPESFHSIVATNLKERTRGISAISNILNITIPENTLGFDNELIKSLNNLDNKGTNDFGDNLEIELVNYNQYSKLAKSIDKTKGLIENLKREIDSTKREIAVSGEKLINYKDVLKEKLENLNRQLNYYEGFYEKIKAEIKKFDSKLYADAGLNTTTYYVDDSGISWGIDYKDI